MAGTEDVPNTRPTKSPTRCPACLRKWELKSQCSHKCEYCNHRLTWKENSLLENICWIVNDFTPILFYLALGFFVCWLAGVNFQ